MAYGFNDNKTKEIIVPEKSLILERYGTSASNVGLMFLNTGAGSNNRTFAVVNIDKLKEFLVKNNVPSFGEDNNYEANVILSIFMNTTPSNKSHEPLTCTRCRAPFVWDATNKMFSASNSAYLEFEVIEMVLGRVTHDHYTGRVITSLSTFPDALAFAIDNISMNNRWSVNEFTNAFTSGSTVNYCYCQVAKLEIMNN